MREFKQSTARNVAVMLISATDHIPREIAVAALIGKRWIPKRIAYEMGITPGRVYALMTAVAQKIGVPDGEDDQQVIGDWWREQAKEANAEAA